MEKPATMVRVKLLGFLSKTAGWFEKEVVVSGRYVTVGRLLEHLSSEYPGLSEYLRDKNGGLAVIVLVNGRNIVFLNGEETKLKNGDKVAIIPPAGGG